MFTYKVCKIGRKWIEGIEVKKGYKAQIEINEISKEWTVNQVVEFEGRIERKSCGRFTKTYIYPCPKEDYEEYRNNTEVEKWLGFVENEVNYVYKNGIEKLKSLKLNETQKERLDKAIAKASINNANQKINDYFGYIKNYLSENKWYKNGEATVINNINILKKFKVDTDFYESRLKELKLIYEENKIKEESKYFIVQNIVVSYRIGEIVRSDNNEIGKVIKVWRYFEEDAMSFGFMVDSSWVYCGKCDTSIVTEDDVEKLLNKEEEEKRIEIERKKEWEREEKIKQAVSDLTEHIREKGSYPDVGNINDATAIYDTFNIYGGGRKILIDGKIIWAVNNNGADGDNWSYNNIKIGGAGAIGYSMEIDDKCKEYISIICSEDEP